jgi:HEAT repeat protein
MVDKRRAQQETPGRTRMKTTGLLIAFACTVVLGLVSTRPDASCAKQHEGTSAMPSPGLQREDQTSPALRPSPMANDRVLQKLLALSADGISEEAELLCQFEIAALGDEAIPALRQVLWAKESTHAQEAAARALSEIGSTIAVKAIADYLIAEEMPEPRDLVARSLQAVERVESVRPLLDLLGTSTDFSVVSEAKRALLRITEGQECANFVQSSIELYRSLPPGGDQASNVLSLIESIRAASALPDIELALESQQDHGLRRALVQALGEIASSDSVKKLVELGQQPVAPGDRELALRTITLISHPDALDDLQQVYEADPGSALGLAASNAVVRIALRAQEQADNMEFNKELETIEARKGPHTEGDFRPRRDETSGIE